MNEVIGLVGASGSGKSTAIDVLLGLIEPQAGSLVVDDERVRGLKKELGRTMSGLYLKIYF